MLQRTADLLYRTHLFFDEIGYQPNSEDLDVDKLIDCLLYTVNHAKDFDDAATALKMYLDYIKHEDKFLKKYTKYPEFWDMLEYNGREEIAVVDDKEAIGSYYITNVYDSNYKTVYISGQTFGNDYFIFENKDGYYSFGGDDEYLLRHSKMSSEKMVLTDKNRKNLATIVLSKDYGIFLENNKTNYELAIYESGIAFFDKEYYDSLCGNEPDLDKECKAFIQWDVLDNNGEFGLSRLDVYDEEADLDLMVILAASCFLVFRSHLKSYHATGSALPAIIAASMMRRH